MKGHGIEQCLINCVSFHRAVPLALGFAPVSIYTTTQKKWNGLSNQQYQIMECNILICMAV